MASDEREQSQSPEPARVGQIVRWGIIGGVVFGLTAAGIVIFGPLALIPVGTKIAVETGAVGTGVATGAILRGEARPGVRRRS